MGSVVSCLGKGESVVAVLQAIGERDSRDDSSH